MLKVSNTRTLSGSAALTAIACVLSQPAFGQEAASDPTAVAETADESEQPATPDAEIVVSGSRAIVDGTNAPTPVTVVSQEQLRMASPSSLIDGLNQLPVFSSSVRQNSTGSSGSGQGGNGG